MPYLPRPQLRPLPQFAGTARNGTVSSAHLRAQFEDYVVTVYARGRFLREIGELVDRSPTAVVRVLDKHPVLRRQVGAVRTLAAQDGAETGAGRPDPDPWETGEEYELKF